MMHNYLSVNMEHFNKGLKPLDVLILAVIESFNRDRKLCYCTNEQFAEMFSVTSVTVANSIDKLEELGLIIRDTHVIKNNGKFVKRRILTICVQGELL